jgi:hypothetical protein
VGDETTSDSGRVKFGFWEAEMGNIAWKGAIPEMKLFVVGLLAFTGVAFGADIVSYHDGTLVSLPVQASGTNYTGISERTRDDYQAEYMVKSEGILYVLTPASNTTASIAERATLGWSKAFSKNSSLYHQPPGAPLQLRDDGKHLFVKVGNRESMYTAIEAR